MNSNYFLTFIFLYMASLTNYNKQSKNCDFIGSVVSAFDSVMLFRNWIESGDLKCEKSVVLLKEIVGKIKEILMVIDKPEYQNLKNFINDSDIEFGYEIEYPYFEMCVLVKSIANILKQRRFYKGEILDCFDVNDIRYNDAFKNLSPLFFQLVKTSNDFENLITEIVLVEYNYIYGYIVKDFFDTVIDFLQNDRPLLYELKFNQETSPLFESHFREFLYFFFYNPRNILSNILFLDKTRRGYVLASADGITFSKRCWWSISNNFLTNDHIILWPYPEFQKLEFKFSSYDVVSRVTINNYMYKRFVQNKVATTLLISLIHFYTMKSGQDTKYEIYQIENDLYEIIWSYVKENDKINA